MKVNTIKSDVWEITKLWQWLFNLALTKITMHSSVVGVAIASYNHMKIIIVSCFLF